MEESSNTKKLEEKLFYIPGRISAYDLAIPKSDPVTNNIIYVSHFGGKTLDEIRTSRPEYANVELITMGEYKTIHDTMCYSPATEITEEQFMDAFESLPPIMIQSDRNTLVFAMSEMFSQDFTSIYVKITKNGQTKFWTMCKSVKTKFEEIMREIEAAQNKIAA